jgi:hypothetical protein
MPHSPPRAIRPIRPCVVDALQVLLRAAEYAGDAGNDPWQFAVEWKDLASRGLERTDVRWLVSRGYIALRREISLPAAFQRVFVECNVPRLWHDTAFVLTDAGLSIARALVEQPPNDESSPDYTPTAPSQRLAATDKPTWDHDRRELRYRGKLVKAFRVPARNQELILEAFEEEGWPEFIDDPLPQEPDQDPHRRLQATIKSLNRRQANNLIRFRGNGSERVFWQGI